MRSGFTTSCRRAPSSRPASRRCSGRPSAWEAVEDAEVEPLPARGPVGAEEARAGVGVPAWAETLVRWLDDGIRVPGTNFRFGLDPILGALVPGGGDTATGAASVALLLLALRNRVPTRALFRMVLNIALDVVLGSLPLAGDVFDLLYRSNRKNLEIIRAHGAVETKPTPLDYLLLGLGVFLAAAGVAIPIL